MLQSASNGAAPIASSASICPTMGASLKPCPENPKATERPVALGIAIDVAGVVVVVQGGLRRHSKEDSVSSQCRHAAAALPRKSFVSIASILHR